MIEYPSQEYLRGIFHYDPDTGVLVGKQSRGNRKAGRPVGHSCTNGYLQVRLNGRNLSVARIIWIIVHGTTPEQIDHINRIRTDNRIANLRAACQTTNARNKRLARNNTSGIAGVHFDAQSGRWKARIGVGAGRRTLGLFKTKELAIEARRAAESEYGYHVSPSCT